MPLAIADWKAIIMKSRVATIKDLLQVVRRQETLVTLRTSFVFYLFDQILII